MRKCIKCGETKHEREFRDYWYARTNVCIICKRKLSNEYAALARARKQRAVKHAA